MRGRLPLILACCLLLAPGRSTGAAPVVDDVPLPGGTQALARVLGIEPAPDRARAVAEFARLLHSFPEGTDARSDERVARLREHTAVVARFQTALDTVQPAGKGVALSLAASSKNDRKRLQDFLDLIGLKLRERKKQFSVEQRRDREAAARVAMLADVGIDLDSLATRLNAGETVRLTVEGDRVPVPFSAAFWSQHIFQASVASRDLVATILGDRRASLLARGLLSLDDATLEYLSQHPDAVARLDGGRAAAFAAFGHALVIHDGRVVTPGGTDLLALWEEVTGESVARPDRFLHELFGRSDGRLAYLYAVISQLDPDRRAFALGSWIKDAKLRRERFKALVDATINALSAWEIDKHPFARLPNDPGMLLAMVRVRAGGAPVEPAALKFWSRAFDGSDFPEQPTRELRNLGEDGVVDAAWLVEQVSSVDTPLRGAKLDQLRFGQRTFDGATEATLGDAFIAVRAVLRFPALMHLLERAGVRTPAVFAAAARRASAITELGGASAHSALSGFQGGLALVDRLARSGVVDREQTEHLVTQLAAIDEHDGHLGQGLGIWLQTSIGGALQTPGTLGESALLDAAAGVGHTPTTTLRWEERTYRVDPAAADARHYHRIRSAQKGVSLDAALTLHRIVQTLSEPGIGLPGIRSAADALKALAPQLAPLKLTQQERPPGLDGERDAQRSVTRVSQDLAKISKPQDAKKAIDEARRLREVLDEVLPETLLTLSYVWAMGDADLAGADGGTIALRHNFGFAETGDGPRQTMWAEPKPDVGPGHPWRARGSLLGLEVAFGSQSLRRLSPDESPVPTMNGNDVVMVTRGVTLRDARHMTDAAQAALADAAERGRGRVKALTPSSDLDSIVRDAVLDGWRARALRWNLANAPEAVMPLFGMKELLRLGDLASNISLDGWGMPSTSIGGCLCVEFDLRSTWWNAMGRTQLGLLPSELPDLNLRVAETLQQLHVPAILGRSILAFVAQSYIDRARVSDDDEWLGFARIATAWSRDDIEDAVAALTVDGPLIADTAPAREVR